MTGLRTEPVFMHTFPVYRSLADEARTFGHESRIRIVVLLRKHPIDLTEIASEIRIREPSASKHMRRLIQIGFVEGRRQGMHVVYFLTIKGRNASRIWKSIDKRTLLD